MNLKQINLEKPQLQPTGKANLQRDLLACYMFLARHITYIFQIKTRLTVKKFDQLEGV